jgi:Fur family transcriptional regulator, ferric uptake regulator
VSTWAEHALDTLAAAGFRRGGARTAVVELLDAQRCALTAAEVGAALERSASRASVYRVLDQLVDHGLASRIEVGQGVARYEPVRADGHHHHLVCDDCGQVLPFHDDELERAIGRVARRVAFDVAEHEITLHGHCGDCRRPAA